MPRSKYVFTAGMNEVTRFMLNHIVAFYKEMNKKMGSGDREPTNGELFRWIVNVMYGIIMLHRSELEEWIKEFKEKGILIATT